MNKGMHLKSKLAISAILVCASHQAVAVDPQAIPTESGFDITPLLSTGLKYDDNVTSVSAGEIDSWVMSIVPSISARLDDGVSVYEFTGAVYRGQYFQSSDDNFTDTTLGALFDTRLSERSKINLKGDFVWGHEDRGTGITEGLNNNQDEPTRFNTQTVSGYYEYGGSESPARIRFGAKYFNKSYTSLREITRFRDYDSWLGGVNFYFATQSAIVAVIETNLEKISYAENDPAADRDSTVTNARLGAEWEITSVTTGEAKVGYQRKDFDDDNRESFNGLAWTVNMDWSPLTYSSFNIGTGRRAKDPLQNGDYVKETTYKVGWTHKWTELIQTELSYDRMEEDYVGVTRKDTNDSYQLSINYAFRRFIDISLFTTITDKTSTVPGIEFDRSIYGINFDFSL